MIQVRQTLYLDVTLLQVEEETDPTLPMLINGAVGHVKISGHCRVTTEIADLVRDLSVAITKLKDLP